MFNQGSLKPNTLKTTVAESTIKSDQINFYYDDQ